MQQPYQFVTLAGVLGLIVGAILFVTQPQHASELTMNPLGVVAFGSLGASVGCLVAGRDRP